MTCELECGFFCTNTHFFGFVMTTNRFNVVTFRISKKCLWIIYKSQETWKEQHLVKKTKTFHSPSYYFNSCLFNSVHLYTHTPTHTPLYSKSNLYIYCKDYIYTVNVILRYFASKQAFLRKHVVTVERNNLLITTSFVKQKNVSLNLCLPWYKKYSPELWMSEMVLLSNTLCVC